jgi:hypothetical protein
MFYIAFFTLSGDFLMGLYTIPYLVLALLCIIGAAAWDIIRIKHERKAAKYFLRLLYMNVPSVVVAFFVPLVNGNRTIGEILHYSLPMTFLLFLGLFVTVPVVGYVVGTIVDYISNAGGQFSNLKSPALENLRK